MKPCQVAAPMPTPTQNSSNTQILQFTSRRAPDGGRARCAGARRLMPCCCTPASPRGRYHAATQLRWWNVRMLQHAGGRARTGWGQVERGFVCTMTHDGMGLVGGTPPAPAGCSQQLPFLRHLTGVVDLLLHMLSSSSCSHCASTWLAATITLGAEAGRRNGLHMRQRDKRRATCGSLQIAQTRNQVLQLRCITNK